jgi:PKD repeat protein
MRTNSLRGGFTHLAKLFLLVTACGLQFMSVAGGATIGVPADHSTIQAAIEAAVTGDIIVVAPGTYTETIDFLGKGITLRSSGAPLATIIDGSASGGPVVQCVSGEGPDTILEGFTITGGDAVVGGGMLNVGTSPTVINCIFTGNSAADRGGGMYNREGAPTVISTVFEQNTAVEMGGGMFNLRASPVVRECRFTQNNANKGAGMRNYINSHPTVTNSVFEYNQAGEEGGGMDNRKNSNPVVTGSLFIGNSAASGGGGMHNYVGRADATGNPTIINSLFASNSAPAGSAMRNNDPDPNIINTTFVDNNGPAISSRNGSAPMLKNCIVWNNIGGPFGGQTWDLAVITHSDIEGGYPGVGNVDLDPLFVNPAGSDYRLTADSPLIDAGANDPLLPATDLDGNPRIVGGAVDMGAYEFGVCTPDEDLDNDGDGFSVCGGDCNDDDMNIHPSVIDICEDGIDNNCNAAIDEGCGAQNVAPETSFTSNCADLSCNFFDASTDIDGSVVSWVWDFGDQSPGSTAQNPTHDFSCPGGNYTVTLSVTDDDGAADLTSQQITATGDCGSGNDKVTLEQVASTNHGSTWRATVRVTVVGFENVDVDAAWSGGISEDGSCQTSGGTCTNTSPGIRKKFGSVTYTVTKVDNVEVNPPVSITVQKP